MLVFGEAAGLGQDIPPDQPELEELLAGVAAGSREALAGLYHRTRTAVYALALSYLRHADDAQDVTQDTFVRVWESAPRYQPQGKPMAWVLTITRNLALMRLRERKKLIPLTEEEWDAIPAAGPAVSHEDRQLLQTALGRLDSQERQVVLLHAAAGLKHRETAALLGLPLSTVLSKYQRALKKLRLHWNGDDAL